MTWIVLLTMHNQQTGQMSPDPFPVWGSGSGSETIAVCGLYDNHVITQMFVEFWEIIAHKF